MPDLEKATKIVIDGQEQYVGNTCIAGSYFLNSYSIECYEDCFKKENQLSYGLQK